MNKCFSLIILSFLFSQCAENTEANNTNSSALCMQGSGNSMVKMSGVLSINSRGEFVFKGIDHYAEGRGSGTYLIPCDESLKAYVESAYDSFAHLKNLDDQFWIIVEGEYLSDNLKNEEDSTSFLVNFVALTDPLAFEDTNSDSMNKNELTTKAKLH